LGCVELISMLCKPIIICFQRKKWYIFFVHSSKQLEVDNMPMKWYFVYMLLFIICTKFYTHNLFHGIDQENKTPSTMTFILCFNFYFCNIHHIFKIFLWFVIFCDMVFVVQLVLIGLKQPCELVHVHICFTFHLFV
jgi:hypothetical protein